jgi:predicted dehydrogenase
MRLAIIGCGLAGERRARALAAHALVAVADTNLARAQRLASQHPGCVVEPRWQAVLCRPDVEAVVVATSHDALAAVTGAAIRQGKHVLVEKPTARSADELRPLLAAARQARVVVKVGFNLRFHPALCQAHALCTEGAIGRLLYVRSRYGHGGRPGYDREWRADAAIAGGGELLDQGVHLIDLARWFLGDFALVQGHVGTFFWEMPVEDNAFLLLRTAQRQAAWLHVSWTEWKNLFSFEVFGREGKLQIDGLGGSYGMERLTFYRMLPQMGPPETTLWEYPGEDASWGDELAHFIDCIHKGADPSGNLTDALAVLDVVGRVYAASRRERAGREAG